MVSAATMFDVRSSEALTNTTVSFVSLKWLFHAQFGTEEPSLKQTVFNLESIKKSVKIDFIPHFLAGWRMVGRWSRATSYFLNKDDWMSSNMASSCFSTSASGTVTFAPESLLTATHWRCCRSLGPTSRRIGTPCMKTKRLFVFLNPLICRIEGWMNALRPWAPSGWTSIQGSSCPGGRSSPWRLLAAGHSGTWSTGSTEPACPALRGKPWSHRGWSQPGKTSRHGQFLTVLMMAVCSQQGKKAASTCRQATLGGSTMPLLSPWTIVRAPMVLVEIPQEFWKANCFSPGFFGSSKTISNILEKFWPRWWDVAPWGHTISVLFTTTHHHTPVFHCFRLSDSMI